MCAGKRALELSQQEMKKQNLIHKCLEDKWTYCYIEKLQAFVSPESPIVVKTGINPQEKALLLNVFEGNERAAQKKQGEGEKKESAAYRTPNEESDSATRSFKHLSAQLT